MDSTKRLNQLQEVIRERGLSGAILFHSRDIFYYSGTAQPAFLFVLPYDFSLFVRRGFEIAQRESFLESGRIVTGKDLSSVFSRMFPGPGTGERVGTEMDLISFAQANQFKQALGDRELEDISGDILGQRMVKDSQETQSIRKACAVIHAGHLAAMASMRPGITELELAAAVENAQRLSGHEGCFFVRSHDFVMSRGPLASGPNLKETSGTLFTLSGAGLSSAIPTGPGQRKMERGDLVLVDIPACIEGYHADQSRTYCIGQPSAEEEDLFGRLREVSDSVIRHLLPGVSCSEIFSLAQSKADELGIGKAFMRFDSGAKAHFIGHGLGLELNEQPILTAKSSLALKNHTVLALEMHVMKKDGPALKLEDTVLVTAEGGEILTQTPRQLIAAKASRVSTMLCAVNEHEKSMKEYLRSTEIIDWKDKRVLEIARSLSEGLENPEETARRCYHWVRDKIKHSYDYQLSPVTCSASEVIASGTGYCFAKSHLLVALLRANAIPAGFCYQRLSRDNNGPPFVLHGLVAIHIPPYGWYRVDPRGNRPGVDAQFTPPFEQIAFQPGIAGEADLPEIWPDPMPIVVKALRSHETWDRLWEALPDVELFSAFSRCC